MIINTELEQLAEELANDAKDGGYSTIIIRPENNSLKAQLTQSDYCELKKLLAILAPELNIEYQDGLE